MENFKENILQNKNGNGQVMLIGQTILYGQNYLVGEKDPTSEASSDHQDDIRQPQN